MDKYPVFVARMHFPGVDSLSVTEVTTLFGYVDGKEEDVAANVSSEPQGDRAVKLTKREIEVLTLVLDGKSSREVASVLFCSKRTVDFHLSKIYDKLQVSNRVQAMRRASVLGILDTIPPSISQA